MRRIWEAARVYWDMGLAPVPLCPPTCPGHRAGNAVHGPDRAGKVPLVATGGKDHERCTLGLLEDWARRFPDANIGVMLGAVSGVVVCDCDGPEGEAALATLLGGRPPETWTARTKRGHHLYYGWPTEAPCKSTAILLPGECLSLLGRGCLVVAPPSRHLGGAVYRWSPGHSPSDGPVTRAPDALVRAMAPRARVPKQGTSGGVGVVPSRARQMARARAYARTRPAGTLRKGCRTLGWSVAVDLAGKFGLTREELVEILATEWGPRCTPPWTDRERLDFHLGAAAEMTVVPLLGERALERTPPPLPPRDTPSPAPPPGDAPSRNGTHAPPRPDAPPAPVEADYAPGNSRRPAGRKASDLVSVPIDWLVRPWIPRGKLVNITGRRGCGKSTFGAWLLGSVARSIVLPGREEGAEEELLDRLRVADVDLDGVWIADGREWAFPADRNDLLRLVQAQNAELVWIDPIASYMPAGSRNDGEFVRPALESLAWVAMKSRAAIVYVRHPGKRADNLNPGAAEWEQVPRVILELLADPAQPARWIIRPEKASRGKAAPPTYYFLDADGDEAPTWRWGQACAAGAVEAIKEEVDLMALRRVDRAVKMLEAVLKDGAIDSRIVCKHGQDEDLNGRTLERAFARLDPPGMFRRTGNGVNHRCLWWWPGHGDDPLPTDDNTQRDTPPGA